MSFVSKIETLVEGWFKKAPHLPVAGQKWIANNVWWIALIGAITSGIGVLVSLGTLATVLTFLGSTVSYYAYYSVTPLYSTWTIVSVIVSILFLVLNGIVLALAVKPLRELAHRGWTLLFISLLLEVVSVVINAILNFSLLGFIFSIIFGAIGIAIGAYFVFEISSYFRGSVKAKHTTK